MITYTDKSGTTVMYTEDFTTPDIEAGMLNGADPADHARLRKIFEAAHAREDRWMAGATAEQVAIGPGGHYLTVLDTPWGQTAIYGRVFAYDELDEHDQQVIRQARARGWLYGRCYSKVEPDGEIGAYHLGQVQPISEQDFLAAKAAGWAHPSPE